MAAMSIVFCVSWGCVKSKNYKKKMAGICKLCKYIDVTEMFTIFSLVDIRKSYTLNVPDKNKKFPQVYCRLFLQ